MSEVSAAVAGIGLSGEAAVEQDKEGQMTTTQSLIATVMPDCETSSAVIDSLCSSRVHNDVAAMIDDDAEMESTAIAPHTDLSRQDRHIWVVTTAALPWRTGTSVNPLARALYLTRDHDSVTLMIPFLTKRAEQQEVFGKDTFFETHDEQEQWIRKYCAERVHCEEEASKLNIKFYEATYNSGFGSIFATCDVCALVPDEQADVCILEEPEHINWMRVADKNDSDLSKDIDTNTDADGRNNSKTESQEEKRLLGWQIKFTHVVGILHTNYDAYVRQYGMGASYLAASALHALSTMVTRAYCHKVIRLSDTLPSLEASREVTSNVHGVRSEFFEQPGAPPDGTDERLLAPIYFVGKLIWAKGFDNMLEIQERFKKETGEYFKMDIYGSGPDEAAIQRACFGRQGILDAAAKQPPPSRESTPDRNAKQIFSRKDSIREQLSSEESPIEVVWDQKVEIPLSSKETAQSKKPMETQFPNPFVILSDLSGEFVGTGLSAGRAVGKIGSDTVGYGVNALTLEGDSSSSSSRSSNSESEKTTSDATPKKNKSKRIHFDPIKSRFELRRHSLPVRFMGMQDHAVLKDLIDHKIFFNPSESEVLCTTSAEALAMGKFVILPNHPSNTFFLDFTNCLSYKSKHECVSHLQWAIKNSPTPLSEDERHRLTWEGANERLYKAAAMTESDVSAWKKNQQSGDREAAKLHIDTVQRGRGVQNLLHRSLPSPLKALSGKKQVK